MDDRYTQRLKSAALAANRVVGPLLDRIGIDLKRRYELAYWRRQHDAEGELRRGWYRYQFTELFDVPRSFYDGRRVLDLGCGPRGSLEWSTNAARRVGLDPLVDDYRAFGIDDHSMEYVGAPAEEMPFDDASFDIVTSLNSLDHVDDVGRTCAEIARVLAPGGSFLLAVDVHPRATIAEPQSIPLDFAERLDEHGFDTEWQAHFEKPPGTAYGRDLQPFDHKDPSERYGVLILRATRRESADVA